MIQVWPSLKLVTSVLCVLTEAAHVARLVAVLAVFMGLNVSP